ncbi:MAG: hypothetical protein M3Q44_03810 [bacterium]|nr:hypothetical protein [bacterium]
MIHSFRKAALLLVALLLLAGCALPGAELTPAPQVVQPTSAPTATMIPLSPTAQPTMVTAAPTSAPTQPATAVPPTLEPPTATVGPSAIAAPTTLSAAPTAIPSALPVAPSRPTLGSDFESGTTEGWHVSGEEEGLKLTDLVVTKHEPQQ